MPKTEQPYFKGFEPLNWKLEVGEIVMCRGRIGKIRSFSPQRNKVTVFFFKSDEERRVRYKTLLRATTEEKREHLGWQ